MTCLACPEREKQISSDATACPQWGHPLKIDAWPFGYLDQKHLATTQRVSLVAALVMMFVMVGLYLAVVSRPASSLPAPAAAAPLAQAIQ